MTTLVARSPLRSVINAALLGYAGFCYVLFLFAFLTFVAFVAGLTPPSPLSLDGMPVWSALAIDLALVVLFGAQHSIMARPWFKRIITRVVPQPVERATYVLAASLMILLMVAGWQPISAPLWTAASLDLVPLHWMVFALGWATVLYTTFLIDHFELFGLRQAWMAATGRHAEDGPFRTPSLYRVVRHPMQLGFLVAFWATPSMTVDRLALAVFLTAYVLTALALEERDLVTTFGDEYRAYQGRVPKLLPRLFRRRA